jgi:hypothetical protein
MVTNLHFGSPSTSYGTSRMTESSDWDRNRAAGSAVVDLTNLFLNPQKPSAINAWQVLTAPWFWW